MDLQKLQQQLIKHEGMKLKPYTDTMGKLTIGVGHNLTDDGLTASQVLSILNDDITNTLSFLTKTCPWFGNLNDARQRAITDLTFDIGTKLLGFTNMIAAIQDLDWQRAHDELLNSAFAAQTGQRAKDLATMLLTGTDPIP